MPKSFFVKKNKTKNVDDSLINQPVTVDIYVTIIIYPKTSDITGYAIFEGINDAGEHIVCVGNAPGISTGEHIRLNGTWQVRYSDYHQRDEMQVHFNEIISLEYGNENDIAKYLEGLNVPGCGKQTIKKIIEKYGLNTIKIINEHPDSFAAEKIFGVSQKVLEGICDSVTQKFQARTAYSDMLKEGFNENQSVFLSERYGSRAKEIFEKDCYFFALDNAEITFKTIDNILLRRGKYKFDSDARLAAGIEYVVREQTGNGHIYSSWSDIEARVKDLLGYPYDYDRNAFNSIYDNAIGVINKNKNIEKKYLDGNKFNCEFTLKQYVNAEKTIAEHIYRLCTDYSHEKDIDAMIYLSDNLTLSEKQKKAVCNVFTNPISIITGGPGTGKSYIAKAISETAVKAGLRCFAAAPTGRAAKRLEEAIFPDGLTDENLRPLTLHRLLKATGNGEFLLGEKYHLHADLIIVDEASMIEVAVAAAFFSALPSDTRVVFMGDVNQLPSVGPGNFFEDLISTITGKENNEDSNNLRYKHIPVTYLTDIYRQKKGNIIISNSERINRGQFPICSWKIKDKKDNFIFIETTPNQGVPTLIDCVTKKIPEVFGLDPVKEIQVLLPKNVGTSGTDKVNAALRDKLNPLTTEIADYAVGSRTFREGDKIMQRINDYDMQVVNGDVGYISSICENGINIYFPDYDKTVFYNRAKTYNISLAYAVTVHKSQGAEFEAVVILIDEGNASNIIKKLLYTAVTRAKQVVVLIGSRESYMTALRDENYVKRRTRLPKEIMTSFSDPAESSGKHP